MKKLIMFVTVTAFAVVAQAAQFSWTASQVREGWDDSTVKAGGTAYLFLVGANGATEAAVASAITAASDSTALGTTLNGMAIDSQDLTAGSTGGNTPEGIAATAPASLFFVVISDDGHVYQSAATTVDTIEVIGPTTVGFGSQKTATSSAAAWTNKGGDPSPEPTSGLLMLVGAGLLGLRRKRK